MGGSIEEPRFAGTTPLSFGMTALIPDAHHHDQYSRRQEALREALDDAWQPCYAPDMTTTTDSLAFDLAANRALARDLAGASTALWVAIRKRDATGDMEGTNDASTAYERAVANVAESLRRVLTNPDLTAGIEVETVDGPMTVADFDSSDGEVTLTQDGDGYFHGEWHTAEMPEAGQVRVERYTNGRREFHGWIDSGSRRLTQTG